MKLFDYVVSGPNKAPPEMPNLKVPLNVTQPCAWPMTLEAMPVSPGNIMRLDRADFLRSVESLINLKVVIDSWMQHLWKNVHINISEGMLNHRLCNCFSWKRGRKRVISNYISHSLFLCTLFELISAGCIIKNAEIQFSAPPWQLGKPLQQGLDSSLIV